MSNNNNHGGTRPGAGRPRIQIENQGLLGSFGFRPHPSVPTEAETEQAEEAARQEVARQVVIEQERRTKRERDFVDQKNGLELLAAAVPEEHNGTPDVNADVTTDQDEESEHESDDEDWDSDDDDDDDDDDDESSINEPKHRRR